ncbi:MAG: M2 family metallopeptidase [Sphingomonadales bacterium]
MKPLGRILALGLAFGGLGLGIAGCSEEPVEGVSVQQQVQDYLDGYAGVLQGLYSASAEAEWRANTRIVDGDETSAKAAREANEAMAAFTGSVENIERAREFLGKKQDLTPLQVKELEAVLYAAANAPQTVPELVKERIGLEIGLNEKLFGFDFQIDGQSATTNDIDRILRGESDLEKRLKAWAASKEVGKGIKQGLAKVRDLRNKTVQALGYDDYFSYQVSDYGMSREEMMALVRRINRELYPLFRELHTYARYELARRYGVEEVPELIPAHWLPNRWGQDWSAMVKVEGIDLDAGLGRMTSEELVRQAEKFYVGLGFDPLPQSFYELSSLYPLPEGADYKKNNHASAWHMDLDKDVRSLMSVETNTEWYETTHHELGHIYYYMTYTNPDVPLVLRGGANRAFHEAMGSLMGLASMQKPFLEEIGLAPEGAEIDEMQALLNEALNYVVFIPFSTGLMTEFEHDLYAADLPVDQFNKRWWELKAKYQGIAPPSPRGEEYNDAASKTHIVNDAAQYYDYALSYLTLFQLHDHISREILGQDPHATNYFGRKEVGDFLRSIMRPGASRDWRKVMREATGKDLSADAMLSYFEPLMAHLKKVNAGREHTLPPPADG